MTITIPQEWAEALALVQSVAPGAFLAGGALRDLDNGREVKDLDVFLPPGGDLLYYILSDRGYRVGSSCQMDYITGDPTVISATEYHKLGHLPLNLIELKADYELPLGLYRFDFGVCQIGWNGSLLVTTSHYDHDKENQRFTVRRCENTTQVERTIRRHDRLSQKYPGWPLVFSEECSAFAPVSDPSLNTYQLH